MKNNYQTPQERNARLMARKKSIRRDRRKKKAERRDRIRETLRKEKNDIDVL